MVPLALVSLVMWTLTVFKLLELASMRRGERSLRDCRDSGGAFWQRHILDQLNEERAQNPDNDPAMDRRVLTMLRLRFQAQAQRFVLTILLLASLAPLLGLLGTVSGMITTFDAIALHGTGNTRALATGISTALITTQTGLIVAVPGLVLGSFIRRRAERARERMERFCLELMRESEAGGAV